MPLPSADKLCSNLHQADHDLGLSICPSQLQTQIRKELLPPNSPLLKRHNSSIMSKGKEEKLPKSKEEKTPKSKEEKVPKSKEEKVPKSKEKKKGFENLLDGLKTVKIKDWANPEQTGEDSPKKDRAESPQIISSNAPVPSKTTQSQQPHQKSFKNPGVYTTNWRNDGGQKPAQHNVVTSERRRSCDIGLSRDRQSQQFPPKPNFVPPRICVSNITPNAKDEDVYFYFGGAKRVKEIYLRGNNAILELNDRDSFIAALNLDENKISVDAVDSMKRTYSPKMVHEAFNSTIAQKHNEAAKRPPITQSQDVRNLPLSSMPQRRSSISRCYMASNRRGGSNVSH
ncbi:hypothetical protein Ddc_09322 [Ditylenchus destructor]|nr:hypothetical protein Ddc_09322 [Ditylenchus destructor]